MTVNHIKEKPDEEYSRDSGNNEHQFSCLYFNIRSLTANNKIEEIKLIAHNKNYQIIAVTETWLHSQIDNAEINIPGYKIYRKDRNGKHQERGGGLLIYVNELLKTTLLDNSNDKNEEAMWISVVDNKGIEIHLGLFYKKPNASLEEKEQIFKNLKDHVKDINCIIIGDFNYPGINWTTVNSQSQDDQDFIKVVEDLFLTQHVMQPTRENNILDIILTTDPDIISDIDILPPIGTSDHNVLEFNVSLTKDHNNHECRQKNYDYKNANFEQINKELKEIEWNKVLDQKTTEEKWQKFKNIIYQKRAEHVKLMKVRKPRNRTARWMNYKIKKEIKKRNRAWRTYKNHATHENLSKYKQLRNKTVANVKECKEKFEEKLAADIKNNPKAFYAYVNSKRITRTNIGPLKDRTGQLTSDISTMGNILNEFFASVFTDEDSSNLPEIEEEIRNGIKNNITLNNVSISKDEISKAIREMKENKTGGPDGIPSSFIKKIGISIVDPLEIIYNDSLTTGSIPNDWKTANVTAIFKKGNKSDAANYRPISLTSHFGKIMESIIKKNIVSFLEGNKLILDSQHGFRQGRSCSTNLLESKEIIGELHDSSKQVDIIYLDFQKAFDKVPHKRLLIKLEQIGIQGYVSKWIRNWLEGRTQRVVIEGEEMETKSVKSGVPQGSILGPILFIIYVNDLDENLRSIVSKFADDTKLIAEVSTDQQIEILKQDLLKIDNWMKKWQMVCNGEKCKVMHVGNKNRKSKYELQGKELQVITVEKDLGVLCTNDLKVEEQCADVCKKANRILGMIRRTITSRSKKIILQMYKSLVRPHLDYCGVVWRPYLQKDIKRVENIQRRTTKLIKECVGKSYEERLKEVKLTTLETRRHRADLIQTYRIIKGIDNLNKENFFTFSKNKSSTLRGNTLKMSKKRFNKMQGKFLYKNRIVNEWNQLSDDIVQAESINLFKNKIDTYLKKDRGLI